MLHSILLLVGGFTILVLAADQCIKGASALARIVGISPLLVGITIVALGTSLPEILVSLQASLHGNPNIAIGNALGSNIANIGLVLGTTAIITPLKVTSRLLRQEFPILCLIMVVCLLLIYNLYLSRLDGAILLFGLLLLVIWLVKQGIKQHNTDDPMEAEFDQELSTTISLTSALIRLLLSLIVLPISSKITVQGAVGLATHFGVSDLVIGLTIVAIGTSLPELVASLVGALKKEHDIAIGNVIGSNMFNLLGVLGLPAVLSPTKLDSMLLLRDFSTMAVFTGALFVFAYGLKKPGEITRIEGIGLLLGFFSYLGVLYLTT